MTSDPNPTAESDHHLMNVICRRWGPDAQDACRSSSIPPELLAALIANESEGDSGKLQFHPTIYRRLLAVQRGEASAYATLGPSNLKGLSEQQLRDCATTWGLTQIPGYQALAHAESPRRLLEPEFNLRLALRLLAAWVEECQLDPRAEFAELFRCWKTGRPDGITADPEYVPRGLGRLALYRQMTRSGPELVPAAA